MPAIFSNTGLQTPPAIAAAYEDPLDAPLSPRAGLSAIEEDTVKDQEEVAEEEKGWRALPKLIILQVRSRELKVTCAHIPQYALLALHDTGTSINTLQMHANVSQCTAKCSCRSWFRELLQLVVKPR
jgi:hypothetical protein